MSSLGGVGSGLDPVGELLAQLMAPTGTVQYRMLGAEMPKLVDASKPLSARTAPRATELITFLALRGPTPIPRVMEALWPHASDQRTTITAVPRIRERLLRRPLRCLKSVTRFRAESTLTGHGSAPSWTRPAPLIVTVRSGC